MTEMSNTEDEQYEKSDEIRALCGDIMEDIPRQGKKNPRRWTCLGKSSKVKGRLRGQTRSKAVLRTALLLL